MQTFGKYKKKKKNTRNMIENVGNKIEENCKTKSINIKAWENIFFFSFDFCSFINIVAVVVLFSNTYYTYIYKATYTYNTKQNATYKQNLN